MKLDKVDLTGSSLTQTGCSKALKTWFASTCEGSIIVGAVGICVAVMGTIGTLIDILRNTKYNET